MLQIIILFLFSFLFPSVNPWGIPLAFLILFLTSIALVSMGLALGSLLESLEGFQVISAFLVFPLFFLSGALFPIDEKLPGWLAGLVKLNPLTYAVDGVRGALLNVYVFPFYINLIVVTFFAVVMFWLGSILFARMK